jgi:hypothetical protein
MLQLGFLFFFLSLATCRTSHYQKCRCELINYISITAFCTMLQKNSHAVLEGISVGQMRNIWSDHHFSHIVCQILCSISLFLVCIYELVLQHYFFNVTPYLHCRVKSVTLMANIHVWFLEGQIHYTEPIIIYYPADGIRLPFKVQLVYFIENLSQMKDFFSVSSSHVMRPIWLQIIQCAFWLLL